MKYLVATDVHGSLAWAERIIEKFKQEGSDKLVLLGDLYYHGPRNPLPEGYAPMEVAKLFNGYANNIVAVRGNCDAAIDQTISEFRLRKNARVRRGGRTFFFTHGDNYCKDRLPALNDGDFLIYGHFHINENEDVNGVHCINLASVSLPKNGASPAYALIDDKNLVVKAFDGSEIIKYCL